MHPPATPASAHPLAVYDGRVCVGFIRPRGDALEALDLDRRSLGDTTTMTLDLFGSQTVVGLTVKLDRPVDREKPCCRNICVIGVGKGPHAGEFRCADCGQHRGWLSKSTAHWIEHVVTRFGAPTTPIIVRKIHTFEEEAPDTDTKFSCREEEAEPAPPLTEEGSSS